MTVTLLPPQIGALESHDVDFKETYSADNKKAPFEMAKDVAAMASARGGVIWIGVVEDKTTQAASGYEPMATEAVVAMQTRLDAAVKRNCHVSPPYSFQRVPVDGGLLLAVIVDKADFPVAVRTVEAHDDAYVFPIRSGSHTKYRNPDMASHATGRAFALRLDEILQTNPSIGTWKATAKITMSLKQIDQESLLVTFQWLTPQMKFNTMIRCCADIVEVKEEYRDGFYWHVRFAPE